MIHEIGKVSLRRSRLSIPSNLPFNRFFRDVRFYVPKRSGFTGVQTEIQGFLPRDNEGISFAFCYENMKGKSMAVGQDLRITITF